MLAILTMLMPVLGQVIGKIIPDAGQAGLAVLAGLIWLVGAVRVHSPCVAARGSVRKARLADVMAVQGKKEGQGRRPPEKDCY